MKVIIPTAKVVSEDLQKIGKLPPVIYPLNNGIVFDSLYEQYKQEAESIDIICYEKAEKVHRRLAQYSSRRVNIVELPKLGELGETIYYAIKDISGEVIINFADTIVLEELEKLPIDGFYFSEDYASGMWTFFTENNGVITSIQDKTNPNVNDYNKHKLFVGVFRFADVRLFADCLRDAILVKNSLVSSFYCGLVQYSKSRSLTAVYTDKWFDIGHADRYYNSSLEVKAREFNHIKIDKDRGILTKTSENVEKFVGEIKWYLKLPSDIKYVRPRIFNYSTEYNGPFISMEYYAYHTLHELFLYGDLSKKQWTDIFARIEFVLKDFSRYSVSDVNIQEALEDIYLTKTIQRIEQIHTDERFASFFTNNIKVNKNIYRSLNDIATILKEMIPEMLYDVERLSIIHGDLCFSNIMVDSNYSFVKLIDPRGKFGKYDIYGDSRYELAKLFHSIDGKYDFIIKDLFSVVYTDGCNIEYQIHDRQREYSLYHMFLESFRSNIGKNLKKIRLIEALLFLSMIPLHRESINHQMVMLATGLDILNRVVDITVK